MDAKVVGIADGTAFFLLGGHPHSGACLEMRAWLPWVSKVFRAENALIVVIVILIAVALRPAKTAI